jgi:iron complex transport system substrate-binding protein
MRKVVLPTIGILLACAAGALICRTSPKVQDGATSGPSITVTDLAGRSVTLKRPVERIVLVRGRDIYALGLLLGSEIQERLVAWGPDLELYDEDSYRKFVDFHPRLAEVPNLGSVYQDAVSAEKVLALAPDLVVVDTFMADRGYTCINRLEEAGLPVLYLDFSEDPYRNPQRSIELLGRVLQKEDRAREIITFIDAELDRVFSRLDTPEEPAPSIYVEAGYEGAEIYGPTYGHGYDERGHKTSWGSILDGLRARNVAGDVVPHRGPIRPEYLIETDPDLIVITGACWVSQPDAMRLGYFTGTAEARARLQAFTKRPGWSELTAVKTGHVHGLYHNFALQTTEFVAAQQLAKWLYPGKFDDLDPEARLKAYHEKFMPVDYAGVWTIDLEEAE